MQIFSKREDVYRVIKAFAARGEWMSSEAKRYTQCLVLKFEAIYAVWIDIMILRNIDS